MCEFFVPSKHRFKPFLWVFLTYRNWLRRGQKRYQGGTWMVPWKFLGWLKEREGWIGYRVVVCVCVCVCVCACRGVHRVTDLEKFPVRISKDEAPTPLPVIGPLFISPLSFHLSRALLGAWRFGLFRCVYSSFHNRLDLIREPAFYWVFYFIFPIYPCLFHHA